MKQLIRVVLLLCLILLTSACDQSSDQVGCTSHNDCRGARICLDNICSDNVNDIGRTNDIHEMPDADVILDVQGLNDTTSDITQRQDTYIEDIANDSIEPIPDVLSDDIESPSCPESCNDGCLNGVCYIDGANLRQIRCPDGMDCHISCSSRFSCDHSVTCGDGKCTVLCEGDQSCSRPIDCGDASQCTIRCLGYNSCDDIISCGSAECNIECGQLGDWDYSCNGGIDCGTNSCQVACLNERSCTLGYRPCEGDDCGGAFTCNEADYCRCMGPGCWPTPD